MSSRIKNRGSVAKNIQTVIRKQLRYQLRKAKRALEIEMDFKARQAIKERIAKLEGALDG